VEVGRGRPGGCGLIQGGLGAPDQFVVIVIRVGVVVFEQGRQQLSAQGAVVGLITSDSSAPVPVIYG
jgi:hypothetical protein